MRTIANLFDMSGTVDMLASLGISVHGATLFINGKSYKFGAGYCELMINYGLQEAGLLTTVYGVGEFLPLRVTSPVDVAGFFSDQVGMVAMSDENLELARVDIEDVADIDCDYENATLRVNLKPNAPMSFSIKDKLPAACSVGYDVTPMGEKGAAHNRWAFADVLPLGPHAWPLYSELVRLLRDRKAVRPAVAREAAMGDIEEPSEGDEAVKMLPSWRGYLSTPQSLLRVAMDNEFGKMRQTVAWNDFKGSFSVGKNNLLKTVGNSGVKYDKTDDALDRIVDKLRCPREHAEILLLSWAVTVVKHGVIVFDKIR